MRPPEPHPFHLANLIAPALDSALLAISDRVDQTEARRVARADDAETLIMSFQPRDGLELMLTGQLVMFHEMLADGARDVLRGAAESMKQRGLSTLVSAARVMQGHLDRLEKRGIQPHRTVVVEAETEVRPAAAQAIETPPMEPAKRVAMVAPAATAKSAQMAPVQVTAVSGMAKPARTALAQSIVTAGPAPAAMAAVSAAAKPFQMAAAQAAAGAPAAASSWLDAPHEEWRVETPADLADRVARVLSSAHQAKPVAKAPVARVPSPEEPALPHQPNGYASARGGEAVEATRGALPVTPETATRPPAPVMAGS